MGANLMEWLHPHKGTMLAPAWMVALAQAEMAAMAIFFFLMLRKKMVARWPFLFASVSAELLFGIPCLLLLNRHGYYNQYSRIFWIGVAVQACLRLGVIADILRSFEGLDFLPHRLYLFVGVVGLTMATASASTCFHGWQWRYWQEWAVMMNHCVAMAWLAFSVALLGAIKLFNFGWSEMGGRIAIGVFTRIFISGIVAQIFTDLSHQYKTLRQVANSLDSVFTIAVFLFWSYLLLMAPHLWRDSFCVAPSQERQFNGSCWPLVQAEKD